MITTNVKLAIVTARLNSREWGVCYIHRFKDHLQTSIAKGSGRFIIAEYVYGKRVRN